MNEVDKNDLFYLCCLVEFIARKTKNRRAIIINLLGKDEIKRQLELAEVNHCLSFDEVANEIIEEFKIQDGEFDTVSLCKYTVPNFQAIGRVYQRLILSVIREQDNLIDVIIQVFSSFISDEISEFNSAVYYSNPDYLKHSYLEGMLLD